VDGAELRLRCDRDAGERMRTEARHECTYRWASKSSLETKLPSGRRAGVVVGRGEMIGESVARSAGSMFSSIVELIMT
jgi:hypothetical protein